MDGPTGTSNFSIADGRSLQNHFIGVLITGVILDVLVVAGRCYARRKRAAGFGLDDYLIIAALGPLFAYVVASLVNIYGLRSATPEHFSNKRFIVGFLVCVVAYALNTMLVKLSILSLYCRLFNNRNLIKFAWVLAVIVIMFNTALILVASLQCIPLSAAWTGQPVNCINLNKPLLGIGIFNVIMDFGILAIPIPFIFRLNMTTARKLQVCGVCLTGAIVCIFSIFRVTTLSIITPNNRTYTETKSGIVSFCEMFVGVIAACLPTFGRAFRKDNIRMVVAYVKRRLPGGKHSGDGATNLSDSTSSERWSNRATSKPRTWEEAKELSEDASEAS